MLSRRSSNLLAALGTALADAQARACAAHGLSASDAGTVITLGQHPGATVGALAPIIGFTQSAAVRQVERLVQAGLVRRGAGEDGREVRLSLTARGATLRARVLAARRRAVERAAAALDRRQVAALVKMMEAMLAALTEGRDSADHICRFCEEDACPTATCPVECAAIGKAADRGR
jgi:DNA-binding MarR family transcriptional regulator